MHDGFLMLRQSLVFSLWIRRARGDSGCSVSVIMVYLMLIALRIRLIICYDEPLFGLHSLVIMSGGIVLASIV